MWGVKHASKGIDLALLKVQPGLLDGFAISLEFLMANGRIAKQKGTVDMDDLNAVFA